MIAEKHSGSATPPSRAETELLSTAVLPLIALGLERRWEPGAITKDGGAGREVGWADEGCWRVKRAV